MEPTDGSPSTRIPGLLLWVQRNCSSFLNLFRKVGEGTGESHNIGPSGHDPEVESSVISGIVRAN